jgi:hypothetical protein
MADETPAGGAQAAPPATVMPTHEWAATMYGPAKAEKTDTNTTPQPPAQKQTFWHRLLHGVDGTAASRLKEETKAVGRGLATAGNQIGTTLSEITAAGKNIVLGGTTEEKTQRSKDVQDQSKQNQAEIDEYYGTHSDDPIATATGEIAHFLGATASAAATGMSLPVAGVVGFGAGFDPHEGLSNLAVKHGEKVPVIGPVLKAVGQFATIDTDKHPLLSRIERTAEGEVFAKALTVVGRPLLTGSVWAARKLGFMKAAAEAATPAERQTALAHAAEADEKLVEIESGTQPAHPDDHVTARPTEDGGWTHEVNPKSPAVKVPVAMEPPAVEGIPGVTLNPDNSVNVVGFRGVSGARHPLEPGHGGATFITPDEEIAKGYASNGGREAEGTVAKMDTKLNNPLVVDDFRGPLFEKMDLEEVIAQAREQGHDGLIIKSGHGGHPEVAIFEQMHVEVNAQSPRYADRGEAEAAAASINHSLSQRVEAQAPRLFTHEEAEAHAAVAERFMNAKDVNGAAHELEGTHFNFHFVGGAQRVKAQIEALSTQWKAAFDAVQHREGVPNDFTAKLAQEAATSLGIRDFAKNFKNTSEQMARQHIELLMANRAMEQLGGDLASLSERIRARPHDLALLDDRRELLQTWFDLTKDVAGANSSAGRTLQILEARGSAEANKIRFAAKTETKVVKGAAESGSKAEKFDIVNEPPKPKKSAGAKPEPKTPAFRVTDGMSDAEVDAWGRMFQQSGGRVRNAQAVLEGLKVLNETAGKGVGARSVDWASKVFINALISGTRTAETIFTSGASINFFEALNKTLAGGITGNGAMAREGADLMYGYVKYAGDNVKSAAAAFREGRSVLDPSPNLYAKGGVADAVVSIPGRVAGSIDEFTRVTAYRAKVRATSLRQARAEGLTGSALDQRVSEDVRMSISADGVGRNVEALEFAGVPTLSDPLGAGTRGGDVAALMAKYTEMKFVAPFIRPGVNTFRYVSKSTPGINLLYGEAKDALLGRKGAEAAAEAWTRTALAGSMYGFAWSKVADGTITGKGPSNPTLRKAWLTDHQPYSVKIGNTYHSYRRMEPFGTFLGLAADAHMVMMESEEAEGGDTPPKLASAVFGALMSNMSNKSYTQGLADFLGALDDQDLSSATKFLGGVVSGFEPQLIKQFNTDPYYREAHGFKELLWQGTPGLSDNLLPKYNFAGEPVLKGGGLWNRNFSVFKEKDATADRIADELVANGIQLTSPPTKEFKGAVDYADAKYAKDGQKLPYERWMELVSQGWDNHRPLRAILEEKIASPTYQNASGGTSTYPGGMRGLILASEAQGAYDAAQEKMLREYPDLKKAWEGAHGLAATARAYGQDGVDQVREKFGIPKP